MTKDEKKITGQYLRALGRSIERVNSADFNHYNVKLKNKQLVKLLLAVCHDKKLHLQDYIEKLLISQLSKNKSYRDYFENNMGVEIEQKSAIRFYSKEWMALQKVRRKGHSDRTFEVGT